MSMSAGTSNSMEVNKYQSENIESGNNQNEASRSYKEQCESEYMDCDEQNKLEEEDVNVLPDGEPEESILPDSEPEEENILQDSEPETVIPDSEPDTILPDSEPETVLSQNEIEDNKIPEEDISNIFNNNFDDFDEKCVKDYDFRVCIKYIRYV